MRQDLEDRHFRREIARWMETLPDEVIGSLTSVYAISPGVFPTTLIALWEAELKKRGLAASLDHCPAVHENSLQAYLPVSHPADADWRYTADSAGALLGLVENADDSPIVHLGSPTTFLLGTLECENRQHILVDRNAATLTAIRKRGITSPHFVLRRDLRRRLSVAWRSAAIIADPPWYLADTLAFLARASEVSRQGATIVLCQPALGTRPGIREERRDLLEEVATLGFEVVSVRSSFVRYVTPHFEATSLRKALSSAVPYDWRCGDAIVLRSPGTPVRLVPARHLSETWREATFGPVRIKLATKPTGPDCGRLIEGDVLTTVSRRDPLRSRIGLWTSGNRVLTLARPAAIARLIAACDRDLAEMKLSLESAVRHAVSLDIEHKTAVKLYRLLVTELAEHDKAGVGK